jgi:uncharacterized protein
MVNKPRLRVHDTQEWYDLYQPVTNDELQKFFDRYTKGIENGWESTPKVRVSLLGYNEVYWASPSTLLIGIANMLIQPNIVNHVFPDWPVPDTKHLTLYLTSSGTLSPSPPSSSSSLTYNAAAPSTQEDADPGELHFTYTFPSRSYLLGSSLATLFVSTAASDDLDVFVQLRKADQTGKILQSYNVPLADLARMGMSEHEIPVINPLIYLGPTGHLRASHRALDPVLSKPHWPVHAHTAEEKIPPGQVTKLDIGVWPGGMVFSPGEQLVVKVSGHWMTLAEYPHLRGEAKTINKGECELWVGGERPSCVVLPFVEI